MVTAAIGFGIVWCAVVAYVGRLSRRQRELLKRCELSRSVGEGVPPRDESDVARAA